MAKSSDILATYYQQWLELATSESRIIAERKWDQLNSLSEKKEKLIETIQDIENKNPLWKSENSQGLQSLIHHVADLETLNQSILQERMKEVKSQLEDLEQRKKVVQQLRMKYRKFGAHLNQNISHQA